MVVRAGVVLQGRYEIVGTLGAGGQATVFEAIDRRLGIHVAVKHSVEERPHWREAFVREARLLAGLRHPSLPIVSDHFVEADGQYLVLELVPGDDLDDRVTRQSRPCAVGEVVAWADQLLDALGYLHGQSPPVIHRDIKPRNLKVRPDGRLILLDFGLAKGRPTQDAERAALASMRGFSHGYAPLEQLISEGTDARSDLYAVGATLYFLLSGRVPPDAASRDLPARGDRLRRLESLNGDVPGTIAGLVHRALELRPERRFQSAAEMRRALAAAHVPSAVRGPGQANAERPDDATPVSEQPTVVPARPARAPAASAPERPRPAPDGRAADEPPVPPSRSDDSEQRLSHPLQWLGGEYHLALAHGDQSVDRWVLATDRPNAIGRSAPASSAPDADLWPDRRVSREHARIWNADHLWWVEDAGSRHGTLLDGRPLRPGQAAVVRPWSEIRVGETTLFLAPPGWRRLRTRDLILDLELVGAVSSSLVHAGLPIIRRLVARSRARSTRPAGRVELALDPCFGPITVSVPPLEPGTSAVLKLPPIVPSYDILEGQVERSRRRLAVVVDGEAQLGESIECWLLPHNEWSTLPEHRAALAAFVLPNHPSVAALASEVTSTVDPEAPAEALLRSTFEVLAERWRLTYRLEPPHWAADSQKVRLPHQVLLDDAGRRGEGTCLDLVVLVAACLENLGLQPVVAIVSAGPWWHALVGCWDPPEPGLETLRFDYQAVRERAIWADPTCATRDERIRRPFAEARAEAEGYVVEGAMIFALDVSAARREGIMPLPFAGQPSWSPCVVRAVEAAQAHARAVSGQLCSAALLAGLLTAGDGLTSDLIGASLGDPLTAVKTIVSTLSPSPPAPPASPGYRELLDVARARAKSAGSPTVLEVHLLGALLAMRSSSLDRALRRLGSDQQRLAQALRTLDGAPDFLSSTCSGRH